ncbi:M10 family metallopeptidase C-terminal domain-containing protein [Magnetospirillum sulfuroxidans]|uniref:FecR domain-containing protein n=1 Tax=Magnetospirillum sulfuroxidans TaxID=611300 RepID=A0ABS5IAG1_9PROT|nr:FecR domain-containing protein [Magnetospirillum sulfuroxidans]MBR9971314.1 FecR domain-containing protein [Magnetospirillum sulfuroxidans]
MSISTTTGASAAHEPDAVAIAVPAGAQVVTLPAGLNLGDAQFIRHGGDLEIVLPDGRHIVLPDFFGGGGSPALSTIDGQMLPADLVARLAGPLAPGQFAQAGGGGSDLVQIGVVDKLSGTVTVRHADGTTETLQQGSPIYQGDEIITPPSGAVGIVLADRSTFSLGSSGRMVMDELVYDPAAKDGHASMSVLKGNFSFVSGQIAHSGPDAMQVRTPVMTIGVRGTTVAGQVGDNGETSVALVGDPGGGSGQITVSNASGMQVLSQPNTMLSVQSSFAPFAPPVVVEPSVIANTFGDAVGSLPVPPTTSTLEWNTVPGQNQPAPTEQIQQRPEAGATIQVDSPGGTQVMPPAPTTAPDTTPQGGAAEPGAPTEQNAGSQNGAVSGGEAAGAAGATEQAGTGATGTGTTGTGTTGTGTGTGGNAAPTGDGNPGGNANPGGTGDDGFSRYTPGPVIPSTTGITPPSTTIAEVIQQNSAAATGGNSTATELVGGAGNAAGSNGGTSSANDAKQVVGNAASGGGDIVDTVINGGSTGAGTGAIGVTPGTGSSNTGTGGVSSDLGNETETGGNTDPTPTVVGNVRIVDGPVSGIFVFRDANNDGRFDVGEAYGRTDASGYVNLAGTGGTIIALPAGTKFRDADSDGLFDPGEQYAIPNADGSVTVPGSGGSLVTLPGGTDTTSGASVTIVLKAYGTSGLVTPLTTLLRELSGPNPSAQTLAANEAKIVEALGLPAGTSLSTDPTGNTALSAAGAKVLAAVSVMTAGLGSSGETSSSVFSALATVLNNAAGGTVDFATALSDTLSDLGLSGIKLTSLTNLASQAAALAQSNPTALDDFLDQNFDGLSSAGVTGDPNNIENIRANLSYLQAQGVTSLHITSGSVTDLSPADVDGLTFIVSGGAQVGVRGWTSDINAHDFSGVTSIVVDDGGDATVVYGYDNFNAYRAITTTSNSITLTYGVRLSDGDSLVSWGVDGTDVFGVVRQIDVEDGAHVTLSAAQLQRMALFSWPVNKGSGNLDVQVSGDVSFMMLDQADRLIVTGAVTLSQSQFVSWGANVIKGDNTLAVTGVIGDVTAVDFSGVDSLNATGAVTMTEDQYAGLRTAGASVSMNGHWMGLTQVSGTLTLSAADLQVVNALSFTGDVTLTQAQYAEISTHEPFITRNGYNLILSVSDSLSVSSNRLGAIDVVEVTGDVTMTLAQYQALIDAGAIFSVDGHKLTVTGVSGDISGLDLSVVTDLVLSGDTSMTPDQQASLNGHITGSGSVSAALDNVSDETNESFVAEAGGNVGFHGNVAHYRFSGEFSENGVIIVSDQRDPETAGFDGSDIITDIKNLMGGYSLYFADGAATIGNDGDIYLDFSDTANSVLVGDGLDIVRLNGGDDTLVVDAQSNVAGMAIQGNSGTDTIEAWGAVDLSGATLSGFEKLKGGGPVTMVALTAAQAAGLEISGADTAMTVVLTNVSDISAGLTTSNWGADDHIELAGQSSAADVLVGDDSSVIFNIGSGDQATGGTGDDIYKLVADSQSGKPFEGMIKISDTGGMDTIDVRVLSENAAYEYAFDGMTRDGDDLVLHLDAGAGGGTIVINDHFNGHAVERFLTKSTGDMYEYIANGLTGTALDEMIIGTTGGEVLTGGGGQDEFFGDGGADTFAGDGRDGVNYTVLTNFNSDAGGLVMTGALSASGDGSATLNNGLGNSWTQAYQGIVDITGTGGADVLYGAAVTTGYSTLNGGLGDDVLYDGGTGRTVADYSDTAGPYFGVNISLDDAGTGIVTGASGIDTTHGIHHFVGSAFGDSFSGSSGNDTFEAGGGNDTFRGGDGWDTITFWNTEAGVHVDLFFETVSNDGFGDVDDIYDVEQVFGSKFDDVIVGNDQNNALSGQAGADELTGRGGADQFIYEQNGQSTVDAYDTITDFGNGMDTINLYGAAGYTAAAEAAIESEVGADPSMAAVISYVAGTMAANSIIFFTWNGSGYVYVKGAGSGSVSYDGTLIELAGVTSAPVLSGGNTLVAVPYATEGDDILAGSSGSDNIASLAGNDTIIASAGTDVVDGGDGIDTLDYSGASASVNANFISHTAISGGSTTTFSAIEAITGSAYDDTVQGSDDDVIVRGGGGDDHIYGGNGADSLYGDDGRDTFGGSGGDDYINGGDGEDSLLYTASSAAVTVDLLAGIATGEGTDTLVSIEAVTGSAHDDTISGGDAAETLNGYHGADVLTGGGGGDTFLIANFYQSNLSDGHDTITDFGTGNDRIVFAQAAGYTYNSNLALSAPADLAAAVSQAASLLSINPNTIGFFVYNGDGYLYAQGSGSGSSSFDTALVKLTGVTSAPIFDGTSVFTSSAVVASNGDDVLIGTSGDDNIAGLAGDDMLDGGAGDDMLDGGVGDDILTGGTGNDTFALNGEGTDSVTDFGANGDTDILTFLIDGGGRDFQHLADGGVVGSATSVVAMDSLTTSGEHLVASVVAGKINTLSGFHQGSQGVFLVSDGTATAVWQWSDISAGQTPADGRVTTGELSLIGVLSGVSVANLTAANLSDFAALQSEQTEFDDYVIGTSGVDVIASLAGNDLIVANGGADQIDAGSGFDRIYLRGAAMVGAVVDGGQGQDSLIIAGSGAINLDDVTLTGVEFVEFQGAMPGTDHVTSVSISAQSFAAAVMAAEHSEGAPMVFGANSLNSNHSVDFSIDASGGGDLLESLSNVYFHDLTSLTIDASAATTALTATAMVGEYATTVLGGSGDDSVNMGNSVTDQTMLVDLGEGNDTLTVGDYVSLSGSAALEGGDGTDGLVVAFGATLNGAAIHGFETITLAGAENWALTGLKISGAGGNQSVEIDIAAGSFDVSGISFVNWDSGDSLFVGGSESDDIILGSNMAETIGGSGGNDELTGNGGADVFLFSGSGAVVDVAGMGTDTITDFTTGVDKIGLDVDFFDLGGTGSLSASQFWESTMEMDVSVGGDYSSDDSAGAGIIVIGSGSDSQVWYTDDVSAASQTNSYQLANLTNVDSTSVQSSDFEKVA